ncbi:MAG: ArnT family glycosyltransferase, partial [Chitinophagales bacterium]
YSTFRLGKSLYNNEIGRLSALIVASAFSYILANNDVRMDAILTACVAFATWQGVEFIQCRKILNAIGLALGLALGFCTKGHIAVFTPAIGLFFYILYKRDRKLFLNWKWLLVIILFALFISPVVYCYYLQYNLHPEKIVRGKDHIDGIKFILLGQSVERFQGESFGGSAKNDYFFFFHSFLWAFAPWSILAYISFIIRLKYFFKRDNEWLSVTTFIAIALLLTFSGFKLPHYLNVIFPATSVMTATWIVNSSLNQKLIYRIQIAVCLLILILTGVINAWAFPVKNYLLICVVVLLLAIVFYFLKTPRLIKAQKALGLSVSAMAVSLFLLNTNFYPQLLKYQGGNELAKKVKGNVDPADIYFWKNSYSSSFNFYTATERKQFDDSVVFKGKKTVWLLFDEHYEDEIKKAGYKIGLTYSVVDFEITRLNLKFINPATRKNELARLVLGEISGKE